MKSLLVGHGVVGFRRADSVLIDGDRILAIGRLPDFEGDFEVRRHHGFLSASRHDHHFHPFGYASALTRLNLKEASDFDGLKELLRDAAARLRPGEALTATRLDDEALAELRLPNRWELDAMVGETPTLLHRYCGHIAVANSAALALADVGDHADGVLREEEISPVLTEVASRQAPLAPEEVETALIGLASLGLGTITAIVSVGDPLFCEVPAELETLISLAPNVPLDFEVLVTAPDAPMLEAAAVALQHAGNNLKFAGWKEFADGALGGRTAALYEPFSDDPGNRGIMRLVRPHADAMARTALDLGGSVALHAIGDRANDAVLDLFGDLKLSGADEAALRIEHASVLTPASRERMANLGIIASVQPSFITTEVTWLEKRLGSRVEHTYALAEMEDAGITLLGGSDCPVETPNPWEGTAAASFGGLSARSAYDLYGSPLKEGGPANIIVLDRDPTLPGVKETRVLASYRHGQLLELGAPPTFV
ncbi:MAG: amidohydrolase [Acidimicrobiia bacterium]